MTLAENEVRFEIFLEAETMEAMKTGKVSWYDPQDVEGYRCDGLDPATFHARPGMKPEVPMKFWSSDHRIALECFVRARRSGRISNPPTNLLEASMPSSFWITAFAAT